MNCTKATDTCRALLVPQHSLQGAFRPAFATGTLTSTPFFLDILYVSEVEEKYREPHEPPQLFVASVSAEDRIVGFERFERPDMMLALKDNPNARKSWIGSLAQYCIWLPELNQGYIHRGFRDTCRSALVGWAAPHILKNPFVSLSLAQSSNEKDLVATSARRCFNILNSSRPKLARNWLDWRDIDPEIKESILSREGQLNRPIASTEALNVKGTITFGVLDLCPKHIIDPGAYFVSNSLVLVEEIPLGRFLSGELEKYDIVVAPIWNFLVPSLLQAGQKEKMYAVGLAPMMPGRVSETEWRASGIKQIVALSNEQIFNNVLDSFAAEQEVSEIRQETYLHEV